MDDIRQTLKQLGLNPKEIIVYLMLLRVGTAPASVIGERTGIQRSTAQYTCKQLVKKGLVTVSRKGSMMLYTPDSPEKLLSLLKMEENLLQAKRMQTQQILGVLKGMLNPLATVPSVRFFEGPQSIVAAYEAMLRSAGPTKELLSIVQPLDEKDDVAGILPALRQCIALHQKFGIRSRVIAPHTPLGEFMQKHDLSRGRETRLIPREALPSATCELVICHDTIFALSMDGHTALVAVLESAPIAHMLRMLFEVTWSSVQPQA